MRGVLEAELGGPVEATFVDFDWTPLAAAPIGQVHKARLVTAEQVVVKVQQPSMRATIERDVMPRGAPLASGPPRR